ncbi:GSCOCG00009339001-RA-CDS [Cotesia congregata]|nr:GSCOCG00009339001-RA-CDS [Cotesia congregata]
MSMLITPWFRNIFTDLFGGLMNFQDHPECAIHELRVVDCLEAYGTFHGKTKCRVLLDDFRECVWKDKQVQRMTIMSMERARQYHDGERPKEGLWAKAPRADSF